MQFKLFYARQPMWDHKRKWKWVKYKETPPPQPLIRESDSKRVRVRVTFGSISYLGCFSWLIGDGGPLFMYATNYSF